MRGRRQIPWLCAALVVAGCGSDATQPGPDLSGQWTANVTTTGSTAGYGCTTVVALTLTQTGNALGGSYASTGTCTTPHDLRNNDAAGGLTNGQINGIRVSFDLGICQFLGSRAGDSRLSGTVTCSEPADIPIAFTGTWSANRAAGG